MPISLDDRRDHRVDATPVDRLDAARADSQRHLPSKTRNPVGLLLNIEVEAPLRSTVGVGDGVSKARGSSRHLADTGHDTPSARRPSREGLLLLKLKIIFMGRNAKTSMPQC